MCECMERMVFASSIFFCSYCLENKFNNKVSKLNVSCSDVQTRITPKENTALIANK